MNVSVAEVRGIRGTELPPEVIAGLPPTAPPAPWRLRGSALVWVGPAPDDAGAALQRGITGRPLAVGGMFVSYEQTPVGPYEEIIAFVALRRRWSVAAHIPFIAVDSAASVVGGRANWSLPKTLATFSGHPVRGRAIRGDHDDWQVTAHAQALGPVLPAAWRFTLVQARAVGYEERSHGRARGRLRPALVQVRASGVRELTGWLHSGRYPGAIIERFDGELGPRSE